MLPARPGGSAAPPARRRSDFLPLAALLWLLLAASQPAQALPLIDLQGQAQRPNLALEMLGMETTQRPVEDLQEALARGEWRPIAEQPALLQAPRRHAELWLQAGLSNGSSETLTRWLEISPWRLSQIDAWLLDPATGESLQHTVTGIAVPPQAREIDSLRALVPLTLEAQGEAHLVLRIRSDSRPTLAINAWDPVAFTAAEASRFNAHGMLLAMVLTLLVVLLLQFNLGYTLLGLWALVLFVLQAEKDGYISYWLLPFLADHAVNLRFILSLIEPALLLIASVYLLRLHRVRNVRMVIPLALALSLLPGLASFFMEPNGMRHAASLIHPLFVAAWLLLVPAALVQPYRCQKPLLLLLALYWAGYVVFIASYHLNLRYSAEFLPGRIVLQVGVILGLLLVYACQKRAHEQSLERQLRQREQQERARLEQAVAERTEALHLALEEARQANAAKTEFLSRITHDLKSPLTAILGYSQLMRVEPGRAGRMSHIIHNSAQHMLSMVTRLIDYARDVTGREVEKGNIYLHAFLDGLDHEARILAGHNANRFRLCLAPRLQPVIRSDETLLREILINLIDNACKYTRQGEVILRVDTRPLPGGTIRLALTVEDTGRGIPREAQARLFEPFFQASGGGEGAGLGLSIVQELVGKLGGTITLESEPGQGTRVSLVLPVEAGREEGDAALLRVPGHMLPVLDAGGRHAWVVEDAAPVRELLLLELEELGFEVRGFASAEGALKALGDASRRPDLILTDYHLSGASGDAVLAATRRLDPPTPVILLSATWKPEQSGYSACLGKPVDQLELRRAIALACRLELEGGFAGAGP